MQDWLNSNGEDASTSEFKKHLESLKATCDPIFFKLNELCAHPSTIETAYLGKLRKEDSNAKSPNFTPETCLQMGLTKIDRYRQLYKRWRW